MCKFPSLGIYLPKREQKVIPRVARSGESFQGAGQYYLHDKLDGQQRPSTDPKRDFNQVGDYALHDKDNRQTAYRVGFTAMLNMEAETPEQAIDQMTASYDRYREKEANKRGRKLTKPVYVYSLSWAPDQTPSKFEMLSAARSSLTALRLEGLQTLIVQHTDEPHPHIHVIVNRIELDGSRARNIAFDQLRFSRWAEQYERDHGGIRCEQRVENNALRAKGVMTRDTVSLSRTEYEARERMQREAEKAWRKEQAEFLKETHSRQTSDLWMKQGQERVALETQTQARVARDRAGAKEKFKPQWRVLYQRQDVQNRIVARANKGGIFERACFVFSNREFLSKARPLRVRDMARLCLSSKALTQRVRRVHEGERAALAQWERKLSDGAALIVWREHLQDFQIMRQRHQMERDGLRHVQQYQTEHRVQQPAPPRTAPDMALPTQAPELGPGEGMAPHEINKLIADEPVLRNTFRDAAASDTKKPDPADDIIRRMEEFKRRNPGHDFGHRRRR